MKKILLTLLILLTFAVSASAAEIDVTHELVTKEVYPGESIIVNVIVTNNQDTDDYFKVKPDVSGLYPLLSFSAFKDVNPASGRRKVVMSHSQEIFPFEIFIRDGVEPDRRYTLNFFVKSERNEEVKTKYPVIVDVVSPEELVKITTSMPDKITPGKEVVFDVAFRNQANMIVEKAELNVDSDLFSKKYTEKLYPTPYEIKKTLKFTPEPTAEPGMYQMIITAFKGQTLRGKLVKNFEVITNPDVESSIETEEGFLTRTITVTKKNTGNVAIDEQYELPIGWFQKLMTSSSEEPQKISTGKIEWLFTVTPGETHAITIKTDYRIFFFTILAIFIAAIITLYYMRRGVMIHKGIFKIKDHKGAIAELKVMIQLLNRTKDPVKDVKVVDILPNMLSTATDFGTLKPNKTQKGERSARLIWDIDELEPGEERVISYKVKPGLHIIGNIFLPAALLRYRNKNQKTIDKKSNTAAFYSEKPKKEE